MEIKTAIKIATLIALLSLSTEAHSQGVHAAFSPGYVKLGMIPKDTTISLVCTIQVQAGRGQQVQIKLVPSADITLDHPDFLAYAGQSTVTLRFHPSFGGCFDPGGNRRNVVPYINGSEGNGLDLLGESADSSVPAFTTRLSDSLRFAPVKAGGSVWSDLPYSAPQLDFRGRMYRIRLRGLDNPFRVDSESFQPLLCDNSSMPRVWFHPLASGEFRDTLFSISGPNFSDTSQLILIGNAAEAGINLTQTSEALSLYPNPCSMTVRLSGLNKAENAGIVDMLGNTVRTIELPAGATSTEIPTADLRPGVYRLWIRSRDNIAVLPLIVN